MINGLGLPLRFAGLGLVALAAAAAAPTTWAACSVGKLAEFSVTMEGRRPTAAVQVNGRAVNLVVDNGHRLSWLDAARAGQLDITPHIVRHWEMKSAGQDNRLEVASAGLTLGDRTMPDVTFVVGPLSRTEGLIGRNVLNLSDVEYDLAKGAVRLFKTTGCEKTDMAYWAHDADVFTVETRFMAAPLHPEIFEAEINGRPVRVMLDSGRPVSSLSFAAAEHLGLRRDAQGAEESPITIHTRLKTERAWITPIDSFKIGKEEIKSTRLLVGPSAKDIDLLLGADFFLSHRIFVAHEQNRLYLTYTGGPVFDLRGAPTVIEGGGEDDSDS